MSVSAKNAVKRRATYSSLAISLKNCSGARRS
jgi:hypothetical protein